MNKNAHFQKQMKLPNFKNIRILLCSVPKIHTYTCIIGAINNESFVKQIIGEN